jgi:uncharacterized protein (TIGR03437 family)
LSKLNPAGSALVYSTYVTGASSLDIDSDGNAYVGSASYGFPTTAGAFQACSHGGQIDIIAAEFAPDGRLIGATYLGGSDVDTGLGVVALGGGLIDLAGTTMSFDFPGIVGASNVTFVASILIDDPKHPTGLCLAYTIQNAASLFEGPISPGEIVTLRGKGIGPEKAVTANIEPNGEISTEIAGVRVNFGIYSAPLLYVQSEQINAVVPWGASSDGPNLAVQVFYNTAATAIAVGWNLASPGLFLADYSTGQAAVSNADGTPNSPTNPAKRGSVVALYGTGGGPMGFQDIVASTPMEQLMLPVRVKIGDKDADVLYAGSAPGEVTGVFQINVRVPDSLNPSPLNPIVVTIGGISSPQSTAFLAVE